MKAQEIVIMKAGVTAGGWAGVAAGSVVDETAFSGSAAA
jgi:hypothetical protein